MLVACLECKASISTSAAICPKCGAPPDVFLGAAAPCRECSAEFRQAFDACQNCGAPRSVAFPAGQPTEGNASYAGTSLLGKGIAQAQRKPEAWSRWGAKWIDTALFAVLFAIVFAAFDFDWNADSAELVFFIFMAVAFPFWDALLVAMSGGSPGRAIFRFRIRSKETTSHPTLQATISRSWGAWVSGCALGIPIIAIFTMLSARSHLDKNGESSWDRSAGTEVLHEGAGVLSWVVFFAVFLGVAALSIYGRNSYYY